MKKMRENERKSGVGQQGYIQYIEQTGNSTSFPRKT